MDPSCCWYYGTGFIVSDSSSDGPEIRFVKEPNSKDDAICVFCDGKFFEDIRGELWVQCIMCEMWAHCNCADCEKDDYESHCRVLIIFHFQGALVSQNMSSGIIISTQSLVLQRVTRWQSGAYTCLAANPRGETMSTAVNLRVRYAPVCSKENEITVIGASIDEALRVRCQVSADPTDVTFLWQFNNSGESFDVSPARFATSSGNVSELMYTPASQRDYGTLTCWGTNSIGRQMEPCIFQVVPAAKPSPLTNCTLRAVTNQTEIVEVECKSGYDGGLPQHFVLEAYDAHSMRMRLNFSVSDTDSPVFKLDLGELLPSPPSLRILVYAENAKGRSEKLVLEDIMLNDAEKRTDGSNNISLVPLAGLLTGSLLTLGMAVLVIVVVAVRRKRECDGRMHCPHHLDIDATKQNSKSRQGSMLEINTGDNRYVVAYTLKPAADCALTLPPTPSLISSDADPRRQPDILNTPRGECRCLCRCHHKKTFSTFRHYDEV
ncbi:hypothetical protein NQ317_001006 [Molorchus minor]|uniref:Ig-like domain-containing protein n=1 Tax=Molorchus minor TaxID=1323400 RepID=A0ABQ9J133_9CUCU|nr:hypothetical protein NQ317_001006 [Molorchus minor]